MPALTRVTHTMSLKKNVQCIVRKITLVCLMNGALALGFTGGQFFSHHVVLEDASLIDTS